MGYDAREQDELIDMFTALLRLPTQDGGRKRHAGVKVNWKVDPGHRSAMYRHIDRWVRGELVDRDSGTHPLVHTAWRALALALQDQHRGEPGWIQ